MDKSDLKDLAVDQRNKYGDVDWNLDELVAGIDGIGPNALHRDKPGRTVQVTDALDESFWRATRDSSTKYGR